MYLEGTTHEFVHLNKKKRIDVKDIKSSKTILFDGRYYRLYMAPKTSLLHHKHISIITCKVQEIKALQNIGGSEFDDASHPDT